MQIQRQESGSGQTQQSGSSRYVSSVLLELGKALKAISFYPDGHPLKIEILQRSYQLLIQVLNGSPLPLFVTSTGFSLCEGRVPLENSLMIKGLAKELFIRGVQELCFFPDLSIEDLEKFLSVLLMDPHKIAAEGGMEKILSDLGIRGLAANEIDISTVFTKRTFREAEAGESVETGPVSIDPKIDDVPRGALEDLKAIFQWEEVPFHGDEMSVEEIMKAMREEENGDNYSRLARTLSQRALNLQENRDFAAIFAVLLFLVAEASSERKKESFGLCAEATLKQICSSVVVDFLLKRLAEKDFQRKEEVYSILEKLGEEAVAPTIQKLVTADNIHARKSLAIAVVRIGRPAVPQMLAMLKDARWYVVRSMLAILGEIGSRECVREIRHTVFHPDARVKKEAIRSLARLGGDEAAEIVAELLSDRNESIVKQAIFALGIMKSRTAVKPLLQIVRRRDFFLKTLALKKEALQALGVIADPDVLPHLARILRKRPIFSARRWDELKTFTLGVVLQIGDEPSLQLLRQLAAAGGRTGRACAEALSSAERRMSQRETAASGAT